MIQSMVNIQLEQVKRMLKTQNFSIDKLKNIPELQCFGFQISDLGLNYKKSQAQLSLFYSDVEIPNQVVCDTFKEQLAKSPMKIMKQIQSAASKANDHMATAKKGHKSGDHIADSVLDAAQEVQKDFKK